MANSNNSKNNKPIIIGSIIAIVLIALIVILIILFNNNVINGGLNDSYFSSDGSKYVITSTGSDIFPEKDDEYVPVKIHRVYYYSGDDITGLKIYYEFENGETAKLAYNQISERDRTMYEAINLDGVYVILTAKPVEYEDISVYDVQTQIEFNKLIEEEIKQTEEETTEETEVEELPEE